MPSINSVKEKIRQAQFVRAQIEKFKRDNRSPLSVFEDYVAEILQKKIDNMTQGLKEEIIRRVYEITPKKGVHYFDGEKGDVGEPSFIPGSQGEKGETGKDGRNGVDGKNGRDGKNADEKLIKPIVEEIVKEEMPEDLVTEKELEKILNKRKFSVKNLADLETRLNTMRSDFSRTIDQRWHGGGMSTGKFISGEVVSGTGTSWTLAHSPQLFIGLYAQGQRLSTARGDYTISDTAITTANSWSAGDIEADYYKQ